MKHERIKLSKLVQNNGQIDGVPKNPRQWTKDDVERLKKSIEETPELLEARGCIVYPHDDKYIVLGGNMRLTACKQLGHKEVECVVLDADTTPEKLKEIVIKDNGSFGAWDFDMLANEWDDLPLADWGVPVPIIEEVEEKKEAVEDDFDEDKDHIEVRCKRGDIWQLGDHRLMCGDSIDLEDVQKLMGGGIADLVITDPPYNVDYKGGTSEGLTIMNDKMGSSAFLSFLTDAFIAMKQVMKAGAAFYIWHADSEGYNFRTAMERANLKIRQVIIWVKNSIVLGRQDYQWKHEPCLYGWKEGAAHYFVNNRTLTTVWSDEEEIDIDKMKKDEMKKLLHDILDNKTPTTVIDCPKPQKSADHPTMKPVRLFGYQIANSSRPGNIILDTFGGSGTTIIACEQLGRKARLMELDPHYCDVIIARWEKLTGNKATKI